MTRGEEIAVSQTGVVTVNVKRRRGPSRLLVFAPGSGTPRADGVFQVSTFP